LANLVPYQCLYKCVEAPLLEVRTLIKDQHSQFKYYKGSWEIFIQLEVPIFWPSLVPEAYTSDMHMKLSSIHTHLLHFYQ
jgi:hypothetical protein